MIKVARIKSPEVTAKAQIRHVVTASVPVRRGPPGKEGPPGPPGDAAENFPIAVEQPKAGDILKFNGAAWSNNPAAELIDGGNF